MIDIVKFKESGFSFEEINEIIESEKKISEGKVLTQKEMEHFIKNDLFSNLKVNTNV